MVLKSVPMRKHIFKFLYFVVLKKFHTFLFSCINSRTRWNKTLINTNNAYCFLIRSKVGLVEFGNWRRHGPWHSVCKRSNILPRQWRNISLAVGQSLKKANSYSLYYFTFYIEGSWFLYGEHSCNIASISESRLSSSLDLWTIQHSIALSKQENQFGSFFRTVVVWGIHAITSLQKR